MVRASKDNDCHPGLWSDCGCCHFELEEEVMHKWYKRYLLMRKGGHIAAKCERTGYCDRYPNLT